MAIAFLIVVAMDNRTTGEKGGRVSPRATAARDGRPPTDWDVIIHGRDNNGNDSLTVCDIHRKCNPRAFTNRIRQGVWDVYGGDAVPFYTNAGLSRSAYSRLISHPDRHPSKDTALAMAASLHLDLPGAEDFIRLAGYALSPSYPEDVVWRMCFERGVHDIRAIRSLLDKV